MVLLYISAVITFIKKRIGITVVEATLRQLALHKSTWAGLLQTLAEGEAAFMLREQDRMKGSIASGTMWRT